MKGLHSKKVRNHYERGKNITYVFGHFLHANHRGLILTKTRLTNYLGELKLNENVTDKAEGNISSKWKI